MVLDDDSGVTAGMQVYVYIQSLIEWRRIYTEDVYVGVVSDCYWKTSRRRLNTSKCRCQEEDMIFSLLDCRDS